MSERTPLSRQVIVQTAIDLMAERGLEAVTLRRIATELGVSAPTLYWYVKSKRELLDYIGEHLIHRCRTTTADAPDKGQPWWEWLAERGRATYERMIAVRDAPLVMAGNRPTIEFLPTIDATLGELVAVGFPPIEAQQVFIVLGGYLGGMALEWQAEKRRADEPTDDAELTAALRDADRFPNLAAMMPTTRTESAQVFHPFEYGLDLLIRGIRSRHEELAQETVKRA